MLNTDRHAEPIDSGEVGRWCGIDSPRSSSDGTSSNPTLAAALTLLGAVLADLATGTAAD